METVKAEWTRSVCPICSHSYPHKVGMKPVTCGHFNCLQVAYLRGMIDSEKLLRGSQ